MRKILGVSRYEMPRCEVEYTSETGRGAGRGGKDIQNRIFPSNGLDLSLVGDKAPARAEWGLSFQGTKTCFGFA
jgi:hypothetical protein